MKIYITSSPGSVHHQVLASLLRTQGHQVYDASSPEHKFDDPMYFARDTPLLSSHAYLDSRIAYQTASLVIENMDAMERADVCVLLLPSTPSSHVCAGYMKGLGKKVFVYIENQVMQPEPMYLTFDQCYDSMDELMTAMCSFRFDQGQKHLA